MAKTIRNLGNPTELPDLGGGAFNLPPPLKNHNNIREIITNQTDNHTINSTCYHTSKRKFSRLSQEDARIWKKGRNTQHDIATPHALRQGSTTVIDDIRKDEERELARWHVPRVGHVMTERLDDTFRIMGGQLNGMCSREVRDRKLPQIEEIINKWDVQACCFQEVGINWSNLLHQEKMDSWFRHNRSSFTTTTAHNTNESIGPRQQGGVAIIIGNELRAYAKEQEPDFRGLGHWCSWRLYSSPTHVTRLISTYNVGKQKSKHLGTIYQQHL